jgi:hypothetical protein
MREWRVAAVVAIGALVVTGNALAGGWATVELSSTPDGVSPGEPWVVDLTILQHGRTPLAGVKPKVRISQRGKSRTVHAEPTERTGLYRARVVFPNSGEWRYAVDDGFSQTHTYPPVTIGGSEPAAAAPVTREQSGGNSPWPFAVAAGLLAVGLTVAFQRRRGPRNVTGPVADG